MSDPRYTDTVYLVEASGYEHLALWQAWHRFLPWQQITRGEMVTAGSIRVGLCEKMPTCVDVAWAILNERRVCFYHACSMVVDHRLVEKWRKAEFPHIDWRDQHCNAMNFSQCLGYVWPMADRPEGTEERIQRHLRGIG